MGNSKRVVIIGAGLGGMAAAITCAAEGLKVTLIEKNQREGGKCNTLSTNGFTFDLGPSILTLPDVFKDLYRQAGKNFEDYVGLIELSCQWRNFFEDGEVISLFSSMIKNRQLLEEKFPGSGRQFDALHTYASRQLAILNTVYLSKGADTVFEILGNNFWPSLLRIDLFRTMHSRIQSIFTNDHVRDLFDYFIKYVGSSALHAPAFMNLLAAVQFNHGLWYIPGGIYNLARGHRKLLDELGAEVRLGSEVVHIATHGGSVTGVELADGEFIAADAVISNMEVRPTYERLLGMEKKALKSFEKFEPSCSGLVVHVGVNKTYPELAHHNFFYSADQEGHFRAVFDEYRLPDDPTVYVVAPGRTDPSVAPPGHENLKILPHIPHRRSDRLLTRDDYERFSERVLCKLERMGLRDLREHIVVKDLWTPVDLENTYYSTAGSIYGVVTDNRKNHGFKAPKRSRYFHNLFFAGGSVNPGGGMPMVTLSGMHAGRIALDFL